MQAGMAVATKLPVAVQPAGLAALPFGLPVVLPSLPFQLPTCHLPTWLPEPLCLTPVRAPRLKTNRHNMLPRPRVTRQFVTFCFDEGASLQRILAKGAGGLGGAGAAGLARISVEA